MRGGRVERYLKAAGLGEALAAKRADPDALWLAGGTVLLAGDGRDKIESVIDIGSALGREIEYGEGELRIGAGATFQEIAESRAVPPCLAEAALSMVNRNTRNRATLGGNLGADKSCSSLIPILLALEAEVELVSPSSPVPARMALEAWLAGRDADGSAGRAARATELALRVHAPMRASRRAAYRRWNRVSCDLSVLGAAAAFRLEGGRVVGLKLALGGLGPKARRFPAIEALFEGGPLPPRGEIERAVAPLLNPMDDLRASAAFKRLRGAQLIADAMLEASPVDAKGARACE
jgi:putative selenate reductase FAD-binding subunit